MEGRLELDRRAVVATGTQRPKRRVRVGVVGRYTFLCVAAAISLAPLIWMVGSAFKPGPAIITSPFSFDPAAATIDNFTNMLDTMPIFTGFRNTAIVLLFKGALTMAFCPLAGFPALILPGAVDAFGVFWMRQIISSIPDDLLDAARIDGCKDLRIFASIVMPIIRPGLAALGVLTFINIYNDFVWPVVAVSDVQHQTGWRLYV